MEELRTSEIVSAQERSRKKVWQEEWRKAEQRVLRRQSDKWNVEYEKVFRELERWKKKRKKGRGRKRN